MEAQGSEASTLTHSLCLSQGPWSHHYFVTTKKPSSFHSHADIFAQRKKSHIWTDTDGKTYCDGRFFCNCDVKLQLHLHPHTLQGTIISLWYVTQAHVRSYTRVDSQTAFTVKGPLKWFHLICLSHCIFHSRGRGQKHAGLYLTHHSSLWGYIPTLTFCK